MNRRALVVAGGGSAGHIHAGFSIAEAWKKQHGADAPVTFICSRGPIEQKVLPREKYPYVLISLGSLNRVGGLQKLTTLLQLPGAFWASFRVLLRERPRAVIGVGGFASGPPVMLAGLLGPLLQCRAALLEQNAVPGMTNRLLKPFVRVVFGVLDTLKEYYGASRVIVSGNPIRSGFTRLPSSAAKLNGGDPFGLFIFGGSQGAVGMNTLVMQAMPHLKDLFPRLRIVHQTGELDYERVKRAHEAAGTGAKVEKFIYDMGAEYGRAALIVSRAGMSTLSELAAVGRTSILVPLPTAADNHQEKNARVYEEAGAARVAPQKSTTGEQLAAMIRESVLDPSKIAAMEQKVVAFYRPDAAETVVKRLSEE